MLLSLFIFSTASDAAEEKSAAASTPSVLTGTEPKARISLSTEERAWLQAHPDVTFGFTDSFEPFLIRGESGEDTGVLVDLLKELNSQLGTRFAIEVDSWSVILEKVKKKEIGAILGVAHHTADVFGLLKTVPYYTVYPAFFARNDAPFSITSLDDIRGKSVAILDKAEVMESILKPFEPDIVISRYPNDLTPMQMVFEGKSDIAFGLTSHAYYIKKYDLFGMKPVLTLLERPFAVGMAVRTDWPELVSILNKWLTSLPEREIDTIIKRWIDIPDRIPTVELTPEEKSWLNNKHTVRVRVGNHPPWLMNSPEPVGMAVDYLNIIGDLYGIAFQFIPDNEPWIEGFEDIAGEHLRFDLFPTANRTPERLEYIAMSQPYLSSPWVVFTRDDSTDILSVEDLRGRKVAAERGYVIQKRLEETEPEIELVIVEDTKDALLSLSTGRADGYIGNLIVTSYSLQKEGISNIKVAAPSPYGDHSQAMATRKEWTPLISIIDKGLASISQEQKEAIRNKYLAVRFEHGITATDVMKWVLLVTGVASGIVLFFVLWNKQLSRRVRERTAEVAASEAKYRGLVDNAIVGVFNSTLDGEFVFVNEAMARMFEFESPKQMIAKGPLERWGNVKERERMTAELQNHGSAANFEAEAVTHTGRRINVLFSVKMIGNDIFGMVMDITERKLAEGKLHEYQARLKALAAKSAVSEEKERHLIATNLHDQVGQSLALARMQLASAARTAQEPQLEDQIEEISANLLQALEDTQMLMLELSSPAIHGTGLSAAVSDWLEGQISDRHGLKTEVIDNTHPNYSKSLDPNVRAILFRNIRELVVNVVKHAQASRICVRLEERDPEIRIIVEDDGVGFDPLEARKLQKKTGGFGLFSIDELMADLGGGLDIVSAPGQGCTAILSAPFDNAMEKTRG
jgi:PAS domain S-box-containing protein